MEYAIAGWLAVIVIFIDLNCRKYYANYICLFLLLQLSEEAGKRRTLALSMESTDKRAAVVFSDLMESLFESVAKAMEIHQPLIETKYGNSCVYVLQRY